MIQHTYRDVECRQERKQEHQPEHLSGVRLDQQNDSQRGHQRHHHHAANEDDIGVIPHRPLEALGNGGRIAYLSLELQHAFVDQVEADVRAPFIHRVRGEIGWGGALDRLPIISRRCRDLLDDMLPREIDGTLRDYRFALSRPFGDTFDCMSIAVARRKRHQAIEVGRIGTEHGFHHALLLDEHTPIALADTAQTHDAVGHHELCQCELLRRLGD